jgi:hypothetical protein
MRGDLLVALRPGVFREDEQPQGLPLILRTVLHEVGAREQCRISIVGSVGVAAA